ncbi:signal peptidase I [Thermococcus peptonophilus]|uniref:S26 family signal peptidase n=1 Tax=Thermococcus peptonophilus TaxID=53952 RepID=A0A142CUY9_9EURY|nr:signal peptidase I [Thermococcus peptonophilus]AMQ18591.1 S26 family signal peptidase [Thermococcus peptonophilus]
MEEWKKDLAWIVLTIIIVAGIHSGLRFALHTDSPLVIVVSGSMEPVFYRGDVVLLKGVTDPSQVKVNDVIVYKRPGYPYPIIHRVRYISTVKLNGKEETCFVTWGDNNPVPDPPYPTSQGSLEVRMPDGMIAGCVPSYAVEAKAELVFPKIGLIPLWIRERIGL